MVKGTRTKAVLIGCAAVAALVMGSTASGLPVKIYADQFPWKPFEDITWRYGYFTVDIAALTPDGFATVGDLVGATFWDFSANNQGDRYVTTEVPVSLAETCLADQCGFLLPSNDYLARVDDLAGGFDAFTAIDFNGIDRLDARAFVSREATPDEYVLCLEDLNMPLYAFNHSDGSRHYMEVGDHWESDPVTCEDVLFRLGACLTGAQTGYLSDFGSHEGKGSGDIVGEGTAVLPSGHHVDVLLIRSLNDFGVHSWMSPDCQFETAYDIHQYEYAWVAPYYGPVATVESALEEADASSWTTATSATFAFGLFPPVSISLQSTTASSVTLSFDPGNDTRLIDRYKVYWDTDSSAQAPYTYAFSSDEHGSVTFDGLSATIHGLEPSTTYYFTVTSVSDYTDPDTFVTTAYESLLFPTQIHGDPDHDYPVEIAATTLESSCAPTTEVSGLHVVKDGEDLRFLWEPVTGDPCLDHYAIVGADDPSAWGGFSWVSSPGLETEWTGSPGLTYYLVVAMGPDEEQGPVGHYGL